MIASVLAMMALSAVWPSMASISRSPTVANSRPVSDIRVRIFTDRQNSTVSGIDLSFEGTGVSDFAGTRTTRHEIQCRNSQLTLDGNLISHGEPLRVRPSREGLLQLGSRFFSETLVFYPRARGCEVINELALENYLVSVVASEFNARWNDESIQAQVVAARTYALYQRQHARKRSAHFDVESTVLDQVFEGHEKPQDSRIRGMVEQTRGEVLVVKDSRPGHQGQLLKAFYHSTCGGTTELPQKVWGNRNPGFATRVSCPYCHESPKFRWSANLSFAEIRQVLKQAQVRDAASAQIQGVQVSSDAGSVRNDRVKIRYRVADQDRAVTVSASNFRNTVGVTRVPSTFFEVEASAANAVNGPIVIHGQGYGHGVGLCQWGAKEMGTRGFKKAQILAHYYPQAIVTKLW